MKVLKLTVIGILTLITQSSMLTKKMVEETYYYITDTNYQRLQSGHTSEADLRERSIVSTFFTDDENWTFSVQGYTPTSDMSKYIGSITFEEEWDTDGGSDGALTLQEALTGVFNQYQLNSYVMQSSFTIGNCVVHINAANAVH
jgi:hypothetical protein